jgi:dTDP-4-dehydrorhamnose 3,5-epimerase
MDLKRSSVDGVVVQPLKQIVDHRGRVMHMLRADDSLFTKFGEIYFSEILPGAIKAWKQHLMTTNLFAVPEGMIRLVLYDTRTGSASRGALEVLEIGRENYCLVRIPPQVWYGFQCLGTAPALVANFTDLPHDPTEARTATPIAGLIPYQWELKD